VCEQSTCWHKINLPQVDLFVVGVVGNIVDNVSAGIVVVRFVVVEIDVELLKHCSLDL